MSLKSSGIIWPNQAKCAVMLTFDVDGETLFTQGPEGADWYWPRSFSYGRFGPNRGVEQILALLEKYGIPATFFTPGRTAQRYPQMVKDIDAGGHEIGCHGYDHELFVDYSIEDQEDIIKRAQDEIGQHTGKMFKGFRAPSGDPTKGTFALLEEMGFIYSSTLRGDDVPYRISIDGKALRIVEIEGRWEIDDYPQFSYQFFPPRPKGLDRVAGYHAVLDDWEKEFKGYYDYGSYFNLTCHPQVIGTPGRLVILEELIQYISSFPDIWFATCAEVAEWWDEHNE